MGEKTETHLQVTGFGPFGSVTKNPTQALVERLAMDDPRISTSVIQVSAQDVDAWLSHRCQSTHEDTIFLHLGVCETSDCYKIESYAYNEATFRIPDARGFQPAHERITHDAPLGASLQTTLCVERLVERLQEFPVQSSTDPGRYVCNYLYYMSLRNAALKGKGAVSVFVHVPMRQLEEAHRFLQCLIREIPTCVPSDPSKSPF